MKKSICIFALLLVFVIFGIVTAQETAPAGNTLPQLQELQTTGLPDPASITGSIGSLYQENYQYFGILYDTYLFPRPESDQTFIDAYTAAAVRAGFTVTPDTVDGYNVLRITDTAASGTNAMLFYDYQGYMLLMVPADMDFSLGDGTIESTDPVYMIERGYEALQSQDYESAVRFLIRAAGTYIRSTVTPDTEMIVNNNMGTPEPPAPTIYTVKDGDTCWGIAVDQFGVNFELFMQVNNMVECNIGIGDEVIIPDANYQVATATPIPLDQYETGQIISYIVQMNDSYNDIANKFNTTLDSIQRLNNVNVYTGFPQYGQTLQISVNLNTPTPEPTVTPTPEVGTLEP